MFPCQKKRCGFQSRQYNKAMSVSSKLIYLWPKRNVRLIRELALAHLLSSTAVSWLKCPNVDFYLPAQGGRKWEVTPPLHRRHRRIPRSWHTEGHCPASCLLMAPAYLFKMLKRHTSVSPVIIIVLQWQCAVQSLRFINLAAIIDLCRGPGARL